MFALGVLLLALGIMVSIALHEVGHLVPAKRFGVKVTQYMIGFGPTIWSRRRGETEYGVKAVPLGGYIRMIGMFPPAPDGTLRTSSTGPLQSLVADARASSAAEVGPGEEHRAFYRLPTIPKLIIMIGGPTMNLLIAVALFTILFMTMGIAQVSTTVGVVSDCVIDISKAGTQRDCLPSDPVAPAAQAGIQAGDRIMAFDGTVISDWATVHGLIQGAPGQTVTLTVERDGAQLEIPVNLAEAQRQSLAGDSISSVGFLGVTPEIVEERASLLEVPGLIGDRIVQTGAAIGRIPARMVGVWQAAFGDAERDPNGPIGVVGVSRLGGEVAAADNVDGWWKAGGLLEILAAVNLALFLFNLIPLFPLDGGHVAGALYEGARRRWAQLRSRPDPGPVDVARMLPVAYAVALVLVVMSGLLLYADLVNPITLS